MADVEAIKANALTAEIVAEHSGNCWYVIRAFFRYILVMLVKILSTFMNTSRRVGDSKSAMTYMVYESKMLNMVLSHPDDIDTTDWTQDQYLKEIRQSWSDCDPR